MNSGKESYVLFFLVLLLPFYQSFLSLTYLFTGSAVLISVIKFSKELFIFLAVMAFIIYRKKIFDYKFRIISLDIYFIAFLLLTLLYVILPIGGAAMTNKLVYFKSLLLPAIVYFLGRNSTLDFNSVKKLLIIILTIGALAFLFNTLEYMTNTHFQALSGYAQYNKEVNEIEPTGNFGLTWTFQSSFAQKRFAAFFANPLEEAASMLLIFATGFILFISSPHRNNRLVYFVSMLMSVGGILFTFSRSSLAGLFLLLFFVAVLFKYYRLIIVGFIGLLMLSAYLIFLAPQKTQYFVVDTLTFRNASSAGHIIEWIEGLNSITTLPLGTGLATSGSGVGVEEELRVGGENQFLIIGVQLGIPGLILYLLIVFSAIRFSIKAYKSSAYQELRVIPFIAASVKFALLMPSMTSNLESYLFVALISWWMVGYSVKIYNANKLNAQLVLRDA